MIVLSILIGAVIVIGGLILLVRYAEEIGAILAFLIGVPAVLYGFYVIGLLTLHLFSVYFI